MPTAAGQGAGVFDELIPAGGRGASAYLLLTRNFGLGCTRKLARPALLSRATAAWAASRAGQFQGGGILRSGRSRLGTLLYCMSVVGLLQLDHEVAHSQRRVDQLYLSLSSCFHLGKLQSNSICLL